MKVSKTGLVVLASSGQAFASVGSWLDWFEKDPESSVVTATHTRTVEYCPCNGNARIIEPATAKGGDVYTKTGDFFTTAVRAWDPADVTDSPRTITKAGPIVVVFTTAGQKETKSGVCIELHPTDPADGPVVTKTIWTDALPTDGMEWIDWEDEDPVDGASLTRWHTKTTTVKGKAPTGTTDPEQEPWADWLATDKPKSTSKSSKSSSRSSTRATSSGGVGPIPGSTSTSSSRSSSYTSSSSSSSGNGVGPIPGSTSSSSSSSTTSSAGNSQGPIQGSTSTSSMSVSTTSAVVGSSSMSTTSGVVGGTSTSSAPSTSTTAATGGIIINDVTNLDYITAMLQEHNVHRRNHSAVDIVWDANLAAIAAQTAATCVYAHDVVTGGGGYGQNIGAGYSPVQAPGMITNAMYNGEMSNYPLPYGIDNADLSNFNGWGHFSQIVWKSTTRVGCVTQFCPGGLTNFQGGNPFFTVCNYQPPGNIVGAYSNVGAPLGQPIVVVIP